MSKVDHEIIIKLFGCIDNFLVNFEFEKENKSKKKWQEKMSSKNIDGILLDGISHWESWS